MGNKPAVTLTLAGDERRLSEAFDRVGAASKQMADKVEDSSRGLVDSGSRFDDYAEKSDNAETKSQGFADVLTGAKDAMAAWGDESLSTSDKMIALGQAGADLAGGFTNFLIPAIGSLAGNLKGGLASAMTFIAAHPLLIVIGLLAAAVIFLITQTDWFQAVATRVFNWVGNLARGVFGNSVQFVIDIWQSVIGFFESLPGKIGGALGSLGRFIGDAFKGGLNVAVDFLNFGIDRINNLIYGVNVVNPFSDVPYIPHVPRLHGGGVFHADGGGEGLALLRDGERVTAAGQGGSGGGTGYQISVPLVEQIQAWFYDGTLVLVGR